MPLFTFIMDYRSGTYVSQVRAHSPKAALRDWARSFDHRGVAHFGMACKKALIEASTKNEPTAVEGIRNVWCSDAMLRGHLALINIVETRE
jgi:hypothetical protein